MERMLRLRFCHDDAPAHSSEVARIDHHDTPILGDAAPPAYKASPPAPLGPLGKSARSNSLPAALERRHSAEVPPEPAQPTERKGNSQGEGGRLPDIDNGRRKSSKRKRSHGLIGTLSAEWHSSGSGQQQRASATWSKTSARPLQYGPKFGVKSLSFASDGQDSVSLHPCPLDALPSAAALERKGLHALGIFTAASEKGSAAQRELFIVPTCEPCRKLKKRCDRAWPICSRCGKLGSKCFRNRKASWQNFKDVKEKYAKSRRHKTLEISKADKTHKKTKKPKREDSRQSLDAQCISISVSEEQRAAIVSRKARTAAILTAGIEQLEQVLKRNSGNAHITEALAPPEIDAESPSRASEDEMDPSYHPHGDLPQLAPPLWSSSISDMQYLSPIFPRSTINTTGESVQVRISRGGIARAILLGASARGCVSRISRGGRVFIDMNIPVRLPNKSESSSKATASTEDRAISAPHATANTASEGSDQVPSKAGGGGTTSSLDHMIATGVNAGSTAPVRALPPNCLKELADRGGEKVQAILRAWRQDSPVFLFLAGRCACPPHFARFPCTGTACGSLGLLPCRLPHSAEAIGAFWASITGCCSRQHGSRNSIRFYLQAIQRDGEDYWWEPAGGDFPGWQGPEEGTSTEGSPPKTPAPAGIDMMDAITCSSCRAPVIRKHWSVWKCQECGTEKAASPLSRGDVEKVALQPISGPGPRMDSGRAALLDVLQPDTMICSDGLKVVEYRLPLRKRKIVLRYAGGPQPTGHSAGITVSKAALFHVLANGRSQKRSGKLFAKMLAPNFLYERRRTGQEQQLAQVFTVATVLIRGNTAASADPQPYIAAPVVSVSDGDEQLGVLETLFDGAERIEAVLSRLAENISLVKFQVVTAILGSRKRSLQLRTTGRSQQLAYMHLGVPALLVVTRPDPLAYDRRQTLLNAMVSQGDIVLLHMSAEDNCDCQIAIESSGLSIGLVCSA